MSISSSSSHLPDLTFITWHAENNRSCIARVSPWSKVAVLFLLIVLITVVKDPLVLLLLYGATLYACILARLPLGRIFIWYALPVIFVLSLVGIIAWGEPGTPVLSFAIGGLSATLTDAGILLIGVLLVKAFIIVTFSLLVLMTTRYGHIAGIIDRLFPDPVNQIFLLSYRFLFLTMDLVRALLKAVRSRGGGMIHSLHVQGKIFGQVFALTFIRSLDRAERVHAAMAARGYRGMYTTATPIPAPSPAGTAILVVAGCITALVVAASLSLPGTAVL
jgi:cobalt/nickel transport system permease protein